MIEVCLSIYLPPKRSERLGQFGVVQLRVVGSELLSGGLCPDHDWKAGKKQILRIPLLIRTSNLEVTL